MGTSLDAGCDLLLPKAKQRGKAMVDHEETREQTLSRSAGGSFDAHFWTRTLGPLGLESPGYQETLLDMRNRRRDNKKVEKTKKKK